MTNMIKWEEVKGMQEKKHLMFTGKGWKHRAHWGLEVLVVDHEAPEGKWERVVCL